MRSRDTEHEGTEPEAWTEAPVTRRTVLGLIGTGSVVALAGCGGDSDGGDDTPTDDGSETDTTEPATETTEPGTPTATPTPEAVELFCMEEDDLSGITTPDLDSEEQGPGLAESDWANYGQSFTVDGELTAVSMRVANYQQPGSEYSATLYSGEPGGDGFEEIDSFRQTGFEDNSYQEYQFEPQEPGTYYLEMHDPLGFPTWTWVTEDAPDIGGSAYVDREVIDGAAFIMCASGFE